MALLFKILFSNNESIKNTRNYMLGQVVNKVLHLLTSPLTTFLLGAIDYGEHGAYQANISIFLILLPLCLYRGVTRFYYDKQFDSQKMLGTQFIMMIVTMCIMTFFFLLTMRFWAMFIGLSYLLITIMMIHCFCESIINFYLAFLQSQKQSTKYAKFSVTLSVLSTFLGLFSMLLLHEQRWLGLVYTNLILRILFAIYACYKMLPTLHFNSTSEMRKEVWKFCLPLLPHMLSSVFLNSIDRIMIKDMVGPREAGLYTFAYNIGSMINIVVYAINQTWGPEFFALMNKKQDQMIQKKILLYLNFLLSCALLIIMFSKELTMIIARREEFHAVYQIIPIISYGYLLFYVYSSLSNYAVYYKKTGFLAMVSCFSAVFNLVLNYYGIQWFGYEVAAYTTLLSFLFQYYVYYFCDRFVYRTAIHNSSYFIRKTLRFIIITHIVFVGIDMNLPNFLMQFLVKFITTCIMIALLWYDKDRFGKIVLKEGC